MHGSDNQNAWWLFLTGDYDVLAPFWKDLQVYLVPLTMKGKGLHLRATNNYFPKTTWLGRINGWQSGHLASYRSQAPGSNSKDEDNQMVFEDWFVVACRSQNKLWWFFQDLSVRLCMFTLFFFIHRCWPRRRLTDCSFSKNFTIDFCGFLERNTCMRCARLLFTFTVWTTVTWWCYGLSTVCWVWYSFTMSPQNHEKGFGHLKHQVIYHKNLLRK